jgi:hypothetical protein
MPKKSIDKKDDDETAKMILSSIERSKENAKLAYKKMYDDIEEIKRLKKSSEEKRKLIPKIKEFKSLYPEITTDIRKHFNEWIEKGEPKPKTKDKEPKKIQKSVKKPKSRSPSPEPIAKKRKEQNLMKGRSDLKKKGDKYTVDTEMNVRKGLEPEVKRALKKSVVEELDKRIKGSGIINLDSSSENDSSSSDEEIDINEMKNYSRMLSHLLNHIKDPKEPLDKKDCNDSKKLIDNMCNVKKKRGRPRKS